MAKQNSGSNENPQTDVGKRPVAIGVDETRGTVYVVNYDNNSVSVISAQNNVKIGEDIPVGNGPKAIAVNEFLGTVYVVNELSNSLSVIEGTANKVVAGVTLHVNPFDSGFIVCDDLSTPSPDDLTAPSPTGQYTYVYSGTQCMAKPNEGFEFVSWEEENLQYNSSQLIKVSRPASSWDSFLEFLNIQSSDEREATLNVTKFGTFTANFKELPPAVPSEYWILLYGIIASTIVGWSIPSIIGWTKSKRDVGKLNYYHKEIASLYGDGNLDENDIEALDKLRGRVSDAYSEGKINEKHYESLRNEISILYEKIFRRRLHHHTLNSDNNPANKKITQQQLAKMKNEIENAYSEGKINEKHYGLLKEAISNLDSKE